MLGVVPPGPAHCAVSKFLSSCSCSCSVRDGVARVGSTGREQEWVWARAASRKLEAGMGSVRY